MPSDDLLTTAEVAEILKRSVATVNRWAAEGIKLKPAFAFPGDKGARLFDPAEVERLADELADENNGDPVAV